MTIAQIGNFGNRHSAENYYLTTLVTNGASVMAYEEGISSSWKRLLASMRGPRPPSCILWTSIRSASERVPRDLRLEVLNEADSRGIPTIGIHLDRYWGLEREADIDENPFFSVDRLWTADGCHDDAWAAKGIHHDWFPPAIEEQQAVVGRPRPQYRSKIAFVGSHKAYHPEWPHRLQLVEHLAERYGPDVAFWPSNRHGQVRGQDLSDLIASVDIVIGDSCLAPGKDGRTMRSYCSDRVFETIGRGGFLIHPRVDGVTDGSLVGEDLDLACWDAYDWDELDDAIDHYLADPKERDGIANRGFFQVGHHHTYKNRLRMVFEAVMDEDDWRKL